MGKDDGMPKGPYTVWVDDGYDGWLFADYETLKEAVESQKFGSRWVVMSPVSYEVTVTINEASR